MEPMHQLRASSLLGAVPGLAEQFVEVPPEWWVEGETGQIDCPCGLAGHYIPRARFVSCPCGRVYLLTRNRLLAAKGCTDEEWEAHRAEAA